MESDECESEAGAENGTKGTTANEDLYYQELGSASLLFKNQNSTEHEEEEAFAPPWAAVGYKSQQGQIPADLRTKLIHSSVQRCHRSQARWYYPLDYHYFTTQDQDEKEPEKRKRKRKREQDTQPKNNNNEYHYSVRPNLVRKARDLNALDPLGNEQFLDTRNLQCVEDARKAMMASRSEDDNPNCIWPDSRPQTNDTASTGRKRILKQHQKYDHSYIPAQWKLCQKDSLLDAPKIYLNQHRCDNSLYYAQQRRTLADPRYLSPFPMEGLHTVLEADMLAKERGERPEEDYDARDAQQREHQDIPSNINSHKETDHPKDYGNCIICIPCSCPTCSSTGEDHHHNWCLLHPIGATLDKLAASLVTTPNGIPTEPLLSTRRNWLLLRRSNRAFPTYNEIGLGDGIRQIEQCSSTVFLVRTSIHVSMITVTAREDDTKSLPKEKNRQGFAPTQNSSPCWGTFELTELQRFDLRSFSRHKISYYPIHVASNRKFTGSKFTNYQYKFAICRIPSTAKSAMWFTISSGPQRGEKREEFLHQTHYSKSKVHLTDLLLGKTSNASLGDCRSFCQTQLGAR